MVTFNHTIPVKQRERLKSESERSREAMADDPEVKSEELCTENETKTDSIARTRNDKWVKVTVDSDFSCHTQKIMAEDGNCSAAHSILPSNLGRPRTRYARDELLDSQFDRKEEQLGRWNEMMSSVGHIVAEIRGMEKAAKPPGSNIDRSQRAEASKGENPPETIPDTENSDSKRRKARSKKKASKGEKPLNTIPDTANSDSKGEKPPYTIPGTANSDSRGQRAQKKKATKGEKPSETILETSNSDSTGTKPLDTIPDTTNSDSKFPRAPQNTEASQGEKPPDTIPGTPNSDSRRQRACNKKKEKCCKGGKSLDTIPDTTTSDSGGQRAQENEEAEKPLDTIHDATNLISICQRAQKDKDASTGEKPPDTIPGPVPLIRSHEQCNEELPSQFSESNTSDIRQSSNLSSDVLINDPGP